MEMENEVKSMRYDDGLTYKEYKEEVEGSMYMIEKFGYTAEEVTNYMTDEDNDMLVPNSTSLALWIISIGEYEIRHNILEDRVLEQLSWHIPRFHMGKYIDDLSKEELEQVKADIEYIESKVTLIKLKSYEDDEEEEE